MKGNACEAINTDIYLVKFMITCLNSLCYHLTDSHLMEQIIQN